VGTAAKTPGYDRSLCQPAGQSLEPLSLSGKVAGERILAVGDLDRDGKAEIVSNLGIYRSKEREGYSKAFGFNLGVWSDFGFTSSGQDIDNNGSLDIFHPPSWLRAYHPSNESLLVFPGKFNPESDDLDLFVFQKSNPMGPGTVKVYSRTGNTYSVTWTGSTGTQIPVEAVPVAAGPMTGAPLDGVVFHFYQEKKLSALAGGAYGSNVFLLQFMESGPPVGVPGLSGAVGVGSRLDAIVRGGYLIPPKESGRMDLAFFMGNCHSEWPNTGSDALAIGEREVALDAGCPLGGSVGMAINESGVSGGDPEFYMSPLEWPPALQRVEALEAQWPAGRFVTFLTGDVNGDGLHDLYFVLPNGEGTAESGGGAYSCVMLNTGGNFSGTCDGKVSFPKNPQNRFFVGDINGDKTDDVVVEQFQSSGDHKVGVIKYTCSGAAVVSQ
jgi:hypothetical protein